MSIISDKPMLICSAQPQVIACGWLTLELWLEVEKDFTHLRRRSEIWWRKVIRDGQGQGQALSRDCLDLVITNALIIDHWGIVKADIGVKNGRIAGIGSRQPRRTTGV